MYVNILLLQCRIDQCSRNFFILALVALWLYAQFIILNFSSVVTPTISPEVMDQIQDEGDTASFTCQAIGEPVPTISWYFNGAYPNGATHTISETSVNTTIINSTLTIMSVESSDVGTYTCNATNLVSSDTSSGVLTVNGEH